MSELVPKDFATRLRQHIQRDGVRGTASTALQHARLKAYLDETHVWYELTLGTDRPRRDLPPELTLVRGTTDHLPLLGQLPNVVEAEARRRLEGGAELWLVLEGRRAAFACWIFHGATPMLAASGGSLALPPNIVCLEDSVTSAAYRGRSVAPAAWSRIADSLEPSTATSIITKIEESNVPSRRAVTKVGFREIATMRFRRLGPSQRTTVRAEEDGEAADWLVRRLQS